MRRIIALGALLMAACNSDASTTHAGSLTVSLAGGGHTDGAIVMLVSGGPVTSVGAPSGLQVASNTDGAGTASWSWATWRAGDRHYFSARCFSRLGIRRDCCPGR